MKEKDWNEYKTRKEFIDRLLLDSQWKPIAEFKEGFEKFWGTPHSYTLAGASAMFELNYSQPMDAKHFKKVYAQALKSQTSTIIEIITNREENLKVHRLLEDVINKNIPK